METRGKKKARERNSSFKSVSNEEEEEEERDRLSELPDNLIHQIFSFLEDTKQAVRTCVLSKRWKRTWASVPYLKFDQQCHHTSAKFMNFVRKVLSKRDNDCNVGKFEIDSTKWAIEKSLWNRIMNYAVSHYVKHLHFDLDHRSHPFFHDYHISNRSLVGLDSMETLKLSGFKIESFCFKTLTLLNLHTCSFWFESEFADPFADCPNLQTLCLENCIISSSLRVFKISGPQLANLELRDAFWLQRDEAAAALRVPIVAPELKSFTFCGSETYLTVLNLSLFGIPCTELDDARSAMELIDMLEGLQNVQFIELSYTAMKPLNLALGLLEQHPSASPFQRLESLKVSGWNTFLPPIPIPSHVKTYLLGNDPYEEITHVKNLFKKDVVFWKVQT